MFSLLRDLSFSDALLAEAAAFAAIATVGYLFGSRTRRQKKAHHGQAEGSLHIEVSRAKQIATELQDVTLNIRKELASHHSNIADFQQRMKQLQSEENEEAWQTLGQEAEAILGPTLRLTTNLSLAYDQLRKQSAQLMTFAGSRTDAETGVHNRRALQEQLDVLFSMFNPTEESNQGHFALALFSIESHDEDCAVVPFAKMLAESVRGTDFVARYSTDEFAVVMPQTTLAGGLIFSQRFLAKAVDTLGSDVWGGVVETISVDDSERLLSRADSALYSARATGESCLYQHANGMLRRANAPGTESTLDNAQRNETAAEEPSEAATS
ncbi:MAG: GGDEF domain-containing protein [Lacipirellulaceae bacterium]